MWSNSLFFSERLTRRIKEKSVVILQESRDFVVYKV